MRTPARFDDAAAGTALTFPPPVRVIEARRADQVRPALEAVDAATRAGRWAYGFVAYEAAAGLDAALPVHRRDPGDPPLVWFAISGEPTAAPLIAAAGGDYTVSDWRLEPPAADYLAAVVDVQERIAAGDTYQVNLTARRVAVVAGAAVELYAELVARQRPAYAAYLDTGAHLVLSASPELFFSWSGRRLLTRPMKGTAGRGRTGAEDTQVRAALLGSRKEQAENLIVVDLVRNDLARIAALGTVRVEHLGRAERYETVWQLTSDIAAEVDPGTPVADVFAALFPSGSITGAPKPSTMGIIRATEAGPRGVYCGAVGWIAPPDQATRARFNVAIRTVVIDRGTGRATYGVGGGITWASDPAAELAELQAKSRILDATGPPGDFGLIETMAYRPGPGVRHRGAHLDRLAGSAAYFGFAFDRAQVEAALDRALVAAGPARVRLTLARAGGVTVELAALPAVAEAPITLDLDAEPVDSTQPWPFHKTTHRDPYDRRARRHPSGDVVLVNERGHVTETTTANLAARIDGQWWTPPVTEGLLAGIERAHLVATGILRERVLTPADLAGADALALVNSLRGWRPAELRATTAGG